MERAVIGSGNRERVNAVETVPGRVGVRPVGGNSHRTVQRRLHQAVGDALALRVDRSDGSGDQPFGLSGQLDRIDRRRLIEERAPHQQQGPEEPWMEPRMPEKMSVTAEADATRNAAIRAEVAAATGRAWESVAAAPLTTSAPTFESATVSTAAVCCPSGAGRRLNICGLGHRGVAPGCPAAGPAATDGPNGAGDAAAAGRRADPAASEAADRRNCPLTMRHCQRSLARRSRYRWGGGRAGTPCAPCRPVVDLCSRS